MEATEGMDDSHPGHFRSTRRYNIQPETDSHNRIFGEESDTSGLRSRRGSKRTQHISSIKLGSGTEDRKVAGHATKTESSQYGAGGMACVPEPYINVRQTRRPDGNPLTGEGYTATAAAGL